MDWWTSVQRINNEPLQNYEEKSAGSDSILSKNPNLCRRWFIPDKKKCLNCQVHSNRLQCKCTAGHFSEVHHSVYKAELFFYLNYLI